MKTRLILLLIAAALVALGVWSMSHRGPHSGPSSPPPKTSGADKKPEVAIQDGKTVDFSSGKPVVKDDAQEKAKIDRSVSEMDAAAKDVTFTAGSPSQPNAPATAPVNK